MEIKNNIRSFRFTDETAKALKTFRGSNMNEKFENIIQYCFYEEEKLKVRLTQLEKQIEEKFKLLYDLSELCKRIDALNYPLKELERRMKDIGDSKS